MSNVFPAVAYTVCSSVFAAATEFFSYKRNQYTGLISIVALLIIYAFVTYLTYNGYVPIAQQVKIDKTTIIMMIAYAVIGYISAFTYWKATSYNKYIILSMNWVISFVLSILISVFYYKDPINLIKTIGLFVTIFGMLITILA